MVSSENPISACCGSKSEECRSACTGHAGQTSPCAEPLQSLRKADEVASVPRPGEHPPAVFPGRLSLDPA